jgi:prevent-host-death family protein
MSEQEPLIKTMKISDVKNQLSNLVKAVVSREARVLIEKHGIPVAALVSAADLERLVRLDQERAERFAVIDELREAFKHVPPEEIERETDRIIARIRTEAQAREPEPVASR